MTENDENLGESKASTHRRAPNKIFIPRRAPSIVIPQRKIIYITADKITCADCTCYPKEEPYQIPKKLNPCQKSPLTLYELAAGVVDLMNFPEAFRWSEGEVADWMEEVVGLPEYRASMLDTHINGMRLLMMEDPSLLPAVNIRNFKHIQMITAKVREEFGTEFVEFSRSIGLPPRKPLTHTTWFKSRTGPSWGIRVNWTRCDVLRWMKIIMPAPIHRDHWDLVWYQKPDFPKTMFARIPKPASQVHVPHYKPTKEICKEYLVPRKFRFQSGIPEDAQMIWMERRPDSPERKSRDREKKRKRVQICVLKESRLVPKRVSLTGLTGNDLLLARRKMPKRKFLT